MFEFESVSCHKQGGVTLVELLVTLTVMAILLAIAVPSFQGMIASSRVRSTTNDIMAMLSQVRQEAIRRGNRVTMCKSADQTQCTTSGDWSQGWIAFSDTSHSSASANVDSGETIVLKQSTVSSGTVVKGNANALNYISYASNGMARTMTGAFASGSTLILRVCSTSSALSNDSRARNLVFTASGRVVAEPVSGVDSTCPGP